MSLLRAIGYIGLVLLAVVVLFTLDLSFQNGDWRGMAIGVGALVLFAFLGNALRLEGLKQKRPYVTFVPNRTMMGLFFAVLGVTGVAATVDRLANGNWLSAAISVFVTIFMVEAAYRTLLKKD